MQAMREQSARPFYRLGITFLEIFPVGLLFVLVCAAVLRRSDVLPANRAAR